MVECMNIFQLLGKTSIGGKEEATKCYNLKNPLTKEAYKS